MGWNRRAVLGRTGIVAGAGTLGLAGSSGGVGASAGQAVLEGTVTHFARHVSGATVRIFDGDGIEAETETDDAGRFSLELQPGAYGLEVRAPGYEPERRPVTLERSESTSLELTPERAWGPDRGELEVFATAVGGGPTVPCEVTVYGAETYHTDAPLGSVPDDRNWTHGFEVAEGWWEVLVTGAEGYGDGYAEVYVEAGDTAVAAVELPEGDREIPTEGTLEGRVADAEDDPISNALVRADTRIAGADDDGEFALDLETGYYDVSVTAAGYRTRETTLRVGFGATTRLAIDLEPIADSGRR